jgi:hypothetical protein
MYQILSQLDRIEAKISENRDSTYRSSGRGGPSPTQSYTITFSNADTGQLSFDIPDNRGVPFVDANTSMHGYTFGDVYDFFSFIKTHLSPSGSTRTPLVTTLSLLFGLPLPLRTPVYQVEDNFYRLSLEKIGEVWQIVQKRVELSGYVLQVGGKEVVQILNFRTRDVDCTVCATYLDKDVREIPKKAYIQILQVTGRPWRFCDSWGQPWKIVRTGDPSYPYRWIARPGTQGVV